MFKRLRKLRRGQPITEGWVSELVRSIDRLGNITAASPIQVALDEAGVHLSLGRELIPHLVRPASDQGSDANGISLATRLLWNGTTWLNGVANPDTRLADALPGSLFALLSLTRGEYVPVFGFSIFEATQNWTGTAGAISTFPGRHMGWTGSNLVPGGPEADVQITEFQGFSGKAGARGGILWLFGRWWHLTSTCPT